MTGTVAEYQEKFLALLGHVDSLSMAQQVSIFTSGLIDLLKIDVELHNPPDLDTAMSLARAHELRAKVASTATGVTKPPTRSGQQYRTQGAYSKATPGVEGTTPEGVVRPFKRLTPAEMAAKREKGLCFNCDEKFVSGHRCLYMLEVVDDGDEEAEEGEDADTPHVSLHVLTGICTGQTMQLGVKVGTMELRALVDSGSTHNFI